MKDAIDRLAAILESMPQRLGAIPDAEASLQPAPGRWSKKEILGHLIDSASNNHQRIVRALLAPRVEFPAYAQDSWVAAQSYASEPWPDLISLWSALNRHLLHVIRTMPETAHRHEIAFGGNPPIALSALIGGYLNHLEHHLEQVSARPKGKSGVIC